MEEVFKEAARQVPALVIVVVLCVMHARSGGSVVRSFLVQQSESRSEYIRAIDRFHSDNITARTENRQTLHENSQAANKQTEAMTLLTIEVRELRGSLVDAIRKFGS